MKCNQCGQEMRIAPEQIGVDDKGLPVYHRHAYCDNCQLKWDLDYQENNHQGAAPAAQKGSYFDTNAEGKKARPWVVKAVAAIVVIIGFSMFFNALSKDNKPSKQAATSSKNEESGKSNPIESEEVLGKIVQVDDSDTSYLESGLKKYESGKYLFITTKDLDKYAPNMNGVKIYTVVEIDEIEDGAIKADISDGFMYSIFDVGERFLNYSEVLNSGDKVAILGEVGEVDKNFLGKSIKINNCYVFAVGDDVKQYKKKTTDEGLSEYLKITEDVANSGVDITKEEYKNLCEKLDYESILRNPDSYDGKYCKVTGTVDQIVEGWLGSYTIYVEDYNGDKWGCVYSYDDDESHLLEGDSVTLYGICKGTANVDTVIGKQVTVPHVDIDYVN